MAEHGSFDGELAPALSPSEQAKVVGKVLGEVSDSPQRNIFTRKICGTQKPRRRGAHSGSRVPGVLGTKSVRAATTQ